MAYLTTAEAAARLGVDPSRIRQLIGAGRLKAGKFGARAHLIDEADLAGVTRLKSGWPAGKPRGRRTMRKQPAAAMTSKAEILDALDRDGYLIDAEDEDRIAQTIMDASNVGALVWTKDRVTVTLSDRRLDLRPDRG